MTLRVPGAVLRLHHDVPPLPDGQRFPTVLAELLDTPEEIAIGGRRVPGVGPHRRARASDPAPPTGPCSTSG